MSHQHICTKCDGNGREAHEEECILCHGTGVVERPDIFYGTISGVCSSCRGNGAIRLFSACSACGGKGIIVGDTAKATV